MNLQAQKTYKYFYEAGSQGHDVTIERIQHTAENGILAYATTDSVGGMGPFTMCFDAETGKGKGEYVGTYLEEYAEGETCSATFIETVF